MSMSVVTQRQSIAFSGAIGGLKMLLERIGGPGTVETIEPDLKFKVFNCIEILVEGKVLVLEWQATPISDMYADTVLASLMQTELVGNTIKASSTGTKPDRLHFQECLIETLQDIFGENSVPKTMKGDNLSVTVNDKKADINLETLVRFTLNFISTIQDYYFFFCRTSNAMKINYFKKWYKQLLQNYIKLSYKLQIHLLKFVYPCIFVSLIN